MGVKYIRVPIQYHFIQIQPISTVSIAPRMAVHQQSDVIQAVRLQLEIRRTGNTGAQVQILYSP
jgi:hypothetical protein